MVLTYDNRGGWLILALAIPFGYLLGYLVDPDLDMGGNTEAKQRWKRTIILYPVVGWWGLYGLIARRFLGGHRSFLTHFPIVSTALRLAWLSIPIIILVYFIGKLTFTHTAWVLWLGVLSGLSIADAVHFVADLRG